MPTPAPAIGDDVYFHTGRSAVDPTTLVTFPAKILRVLDVKEGVVDVCIFDDDGGTQLREAVAFSETPAPRRWSWPKAKVEYFSLGPSTSLEDIAVLNERLQAVGVVGVLLPYGVERVAFAPFTAQPPSYDEVMALLRSYLYTRVGDDPAKVAMDLSDALVKVGAISPPKPAPITDR